MVRLVTKSRIDGEFNGWEGDTIFELVNGQKWQQSTYKYKYIYKYRPEIKIWEDKGQYLLEVEGVDEKLPVRKIT